ncbi:hypothetical protein IJ596_02575 [bacterium]|nr:hypothetical protein [bacterium]
MLNQNINGVSPSAVTPQINYTDVIQEIELALQADFQKLQLLIQQGIVTQQQGQYLMNELVNKKQQIDVFKQSVGNFDYKPDVQKLPQDTQNENPLDIFVKENPEFFTNEGRKELFEYIKNLDVDKDEISKIAKLAQDLENYAVDSYLKKSAHDKSLNDENFIAKSRLTSYAQHAPSDSNYSRIFTREDIGKMSGEEFTKNEKLIMEQVKQGLIK